MYIRKAVRQCIVRAMEQRGSYDDYCTICPCCGQDGFLAVTRVTLVHQRRARLALQAPLAPDGFDVGFYAGDASTENERVTCAACQRSFPLYYAMYDYYEDERPAQRR